MLGEETYFAYIATDIVRTLRAYPLVLLIGKILGTCQCLMNLQLKLSGSIAACSSYAYAIACRFLLSQFRERFFDGCIAVLKVVMLHCCRGRLLRRLAFPR